MELFTTFDGRINRQKLWLGSIALIVVGIVLGIVLSLISGGNATFMALAGLILYLVLLYPGLALTIKRLHDRDKPAMPWVAIFFAPGLLLQVMQATGIGFSPVNTPEGVMMMPDMLGGVVGLVALVVGIWALVELGFLKGTPGPNQFGPDPLG